MTCGLTFESHALGVDRDDEVDVCRVIIQIDVWSVNGGCVRGGVQREVWRS